MSILSDLKNHLGSRFYVNSLINLKACNYNIVCNNIMCYKIRTILVKWVELP